MKTGNCVKCNSPLREEMYEVKVYLSIVHITNYHFVVYDVIRKAEIAYDAVIQESKGR